MHSVEMAPTRKTTPPALLPLLVAILLLLKVNICDGRQISAAKFASQQQKLIVFLLDGVRWDYITDDLQGFQSIIRGGVKADHLKPTFPTVSYSNYYSITTGRYCESHGMVHNWMYDREHNETFWIGTNPESFHSYWWEDGDPIYITAERQGLRSHLHYWPDCQVSIRGVTPSFCEPYPGHVPTNDNFTQAITLAVEALQNGEADYVGIYYEATDKHGHKYGPNSQEVRDDLAFVDGEFQRLLRLLNKTMMTDGKTKMADIVNIMVTSDHGMLSSTEGNIYLSELIEEEDVFIFLGGGSVMQIEPAEGKLDKLYDALHDQDHFTAYKKQDLPEEFHIKNHRRTSPLWLLPDAGWQFVKPPHTPSNPPNENLGDHGYLPDVPEMNGIFYAIGPAFKAGYRKDGFVNVELYQVMCHILDIEASAHNGTWQNVNDMLRLKNNAAGARPPSWNMAVVLLFTILSYLPSHY